MRSFFSRSPDLEGGQSRGYKKGFTGDHRGRSHIPPNPSPLFSPQSQHSPFSIPSASYRHDTIFRAPPSPSPKSVTFSDRSWSALSGPGNVSGHSAAAAAAHLGDTRGERGHLDLDQEQLSRLQEFLGVLPAREAPQTQRGRRGFSLSDPNERPLHTSPNAVPIPAPTSIPLSPHSRLKKNLKHQVAEHQFRRQNQSGSAALSHDVLLGDEDRRVQYQTRVFKEALRTALSMREDEGKGDGDGDGEGKRPVMQRRGASEGVREGGFTGPMERERGEDVVPRDLSEFLEKYDPRPEDLPDVYPMGEQRAMLRTMYLEDILHSTAKLHMHNWILLSRNEKYENLRIPARWDQIQEDLEKYTRSIRNYEYWLTSLIPVLELPKTSLPPRFHLYGKQLAILECARKWNHPREVELVGELERKLVAYQTDWSVSNGVWRGVRRETRKRGWRRGGRGGRCVWRILGGMIAHTIPSLLSSEIIKSPLTTLSPQGGSSILAPISILLLWPGGISRNGGVGIIGVSVAILGIILVWIMDGGGQKKSGWEGVEGERDRDGRGGFSEWGMKDVMMVLGAYAGVLAVFLGVAVV